MGYAVAPDSRLRDAGPLLAQRSGAGSPVLACAAGVAKSQQKDNNLRFDCNVLYTRAQCAIHMDVPGIDSVMPGMTFMAQTLAALRDNGLTQQEFDALITRKTDELGKLFATYARTGTDVLMEQRLRSQQNGVVDIAPEQYQKLRQHYLFVDAGYAESGVAPAAFTRGHADADTAAG